MNQREYIFKVYPEEENQRLDQFLKKKLVDISRNKIKELVKKNFILVNLKYSKPSYKVKKGDLIQIILPSEEKIEIIPKEVPFEIIYEDEDIAVINKPSGIVVHPGPGHYDNILVQGLLLKLKNLSTIGGKIRPGIVHRLDKETSGIMIVAKNDFSHKKLALDFKERKIEKIYLALVYGKVSFKEGKIETYIGRHPVNRKKMAVLKEGKLAITFYQVLEIFKKVSLVSIKPLTGRTHQIRVHFSHIGHPILGDPIYGGIKHDIPRPTRLMLHSYKISFIHPKTLQKLEFIAPLPKDFKNYLEIIKN